MLTYISPKDIIASIPDDLVDLDQYIPIYVDGLVLYHGTRGDYNHVASTLAGRDIKGIAYIQRYLGMDIYSNILPRTVKAIYTRKSKGCTIL